MIGSNVTFAASLADVNAVNTAYASDDDREQQKRDLIELFS